MNIPLSDDQKVKINSDKLFSIMREVLLREHEIDQDKEHFWVAGLANNDRLMYLELVSLGSVNATIVEPMDIFSWALQKRCVKIILIHNHPSGELNASKADLDVTDRMIQVGNIVRVEVLDHLIISTEDYYSFLEDGVMVALAASQKWVPDYKKKEEMERKAVEAASKNLLHDLAHKMQKEGIDKNVIKKMTGVEL